MKTIQEKILFAGCIIMLIVSLAFGVVWLRKFMQPKPQAAQTAIVLSNSYFELDMPILYATNVYRREMSVVNSGTEKGKNWYDGTWKWYVLRDLNMEIDYLVVLYEGHGIAVTKLDNQP